ncbi:unnamed protein product, partial [Amoebophrya sp. A25]
RLLGSDPGGYWRLRAGALRLRLSNSSGSGVQVEPPARATTRQTGQERSRNEGGGLCGVITTILDPGGVVENFVERHRGATLIVIGDERTNNATWAHFSDRNGGRVHFIPLGAQEQLGYMITKHLPHSHFA